MVEIKRRNEETKRKNEDEILTLQKENEGMKKFVKEGPSIGPTHPTGRSFTTPTGPRTVKELKDKIHTQEANDESYMNRSIPTSDTLNLTH